MTEKEFTDAIKKNDLFSIGNLIKSKFRIIQNRRDQNFRNTCRITKMENMMKKVVRLDGV